MLYLSVRLITGSPFAAAQPRVDASLSTIQGYFGKVVHKREDAKMGIDRESTKIWSETLKNVVQVIAIIVAGYWTYHTFIQKESPALEPRASPSSSLDWNSVGRATDECEAVFRVDIENNGTASFDISKVQVRGWMFDRIKQTDKAATYLELTEVQGKEQPFFDKTYSYSATAKDANVSFPFVGHYPPGGKFGHSFVWIVSRVPIKWVFFRADFYTKRDESQPKWYTGQWGMVCADKQKKRKDNS